jgi:hypothetical protein
MLDSTDTVQQPGEFTRVFGPYLAARLHVNALPEAIPGATASQHDEFEKFFPSQVEHVPACGRSLSDDCHRVAPSVQKMLDELASQIVGQQRSGNGGVLPTRDSQLAPPVPLPVFQLPPELGPPEADGPSARHWPYELEFEGWAVPYVACTCPPPANSYSLREFVLTAGIALTVCGVATAIGIVCIAT